MNEATENLKKIAILGQKGSFHEIAAKKYFGEDISINMYNSFPELFDSIEENDSDYGVMAIENTVAGTILPNYALLRESNLSIIGEVHLRIEHHLMAISGQNIENITEVYSHPMALNQCRKFFKDNKAIKLIESSDTASSAKWIKENNIEGAGAIASSLAAEQYNLDILENNIEDSDKNFTRFLIIVDKKKQKGVQERSYNRATICFSLSHKIGSLAEILTVLSSDKMNLIKIQSLPVIGKEWEYFFHIDVTFSHKRFFIKAMAALEPLVNELRILGTYKRQN